MLDRSYRTRIAVKRICCLFLFALYLLASSFASAATSSEQVPSSVKIPDARLVEKLLKANYKVTDPLPSSANSYYSVVPRLSDRKVLDWLDCKYQVLDVQDFDTQEFFRCQKILLVTVNYIILEAGALSGMRSTGIFAFDGTSLTYLNGPDSLGNVAAALKQENRPLELCDANMLAEFFSHTILRQNNDKIYLLQPLKDISNPDMPDAKDAKKTSGRPCPCGPDRAELQKYGKQITSPKITGDAKNGWVCHFVGLRGWMYKERGSYPVVAYDVMVSPSFDINVKEKELQKEQQ